jgi:hypothetical protein
LDGVTLHGGGPSQSMLPTLTVQPGVKLLPAGMLNTKQAGAPISKLPFWNGAAPAQALKANSKLAKHSLAIRLIDIPLV